MKKILVTGGAGFIGSHLCDYLVAEKNQVIALDNLCLGKETNISHLLCQGNFKFYKEDILNYEEMSKIFRKENFQEVFHLAANSDIARSRENPNIDFNNTFLATYNILNLMREYGIRQIVFASSSAIYGEAKGKIREDHGPLFPLSHYGASKLASEAFIASFVENYSMQAWIFRFPNVVGERATHGVLVDFIDKLKVSPEELVVLGDGEQCKQYLYVKDLVEAMLFIRKKSRGKINCHNIGVSSRTKVKKIAQIVIEELGLKVRIKYTGGERGWVGDVPTFDYDLNKMNELGWKAKFSSDDAIRMAIREMLKK